MYEKSRPGKDGFSFGVRTVTFATCFVTSLLTRVSAYEFSDAGMRCLAVLLVDPMRKVGRWQPEDGCESSDLGSLVDARIGGGV